MAEQAHKALEAGSVIGGGIVGAIIAASALIIVGSMKLRGTFLGHLISRNAHLEGLLRDDRQAHERDMLQLREYYETRIQSICRAHEGQVREVREYYDREITAMRQELHDLRAQMNHHDTQRGQDHE